jgi:hypothetical protein
MEFKAGDKVKIVKNSHKGRMGEIVGIFSDQQTCRVRIDKDVDGSSDFLSAGIVVGYFFSELELLDAKCEALIELAETLDRARQQANAHPNYVIESGNGVHGQISHSLHDVLEQIVGDEDGNGSWGAGRIYQSILDGNTVRQALDMWEGQK